MGRSGGLVGAAFDVYDGIRGLKRDQALFEAGSMNPEERAQVDVVDYKPSQQTTEDGYVVDGPLVGTTRTESPKSFKMGNLVQDTPFNPDQIRGERARQQGDVYSQYGDTREAANSYLTAKSADEQGITNKINTGVTEGLKRDYADLKGMDREFRSIELAATGMLKAGRYPEYAQLSKAAEGLQSKLLNADLDRTEMITDPKAKLTAAVGAHSKYVLDGKYGEIVGDNPDGTFHIKEKDGKVVADGISPDPANPKSVNKIISALRNPEMVRKLQQDALEQRQKQDIAEAAPSKKASTDKDTATAEYYRGAKTTMAEAQAEAARAKAQGAGSGIQQQKWDAQQLKDFKADIFPVISFPNNVTQKNEVNLDGDQLVHSLASAGYSPQFIRDKVYSLRAENPEPEKFSLAARQVISNLRSGPPAAPAPQPAPRPAAPIAQPVARPVQVASPSIQAPAQAPGLQREQPMSPTRIPSPPPQYIGMSKQINPSWVQWNEAYGVDAYAQQQEADAITLKNAQVLARAKINSLRSNGNAFHPYGN